MTTTARVTVTLELTGLGSWGADCNLEQVYKQATDQAVGRLRNGLDAQKFKIVGDVKVEAIIHGNDK